MGQNSIFLSLLFAVIFILSTASADAAIIYVDDSAPAGGDGTSWNTAFDDLQDALDIAVAGDQVWVGQGTYIPTWRFIALDPRSATFQMKSDVSILGGFAGFGESSPNLWNIHVYRTILDGDINRDDGPNFTNRSDNSYHVVYNNSNYLTYSAVLAGCVIRGGNADSLEPHCFGGGMYNNKSSPMLLNCIFQENEADGGGGVWNQEASPFFINCVFYGNLARSGSFEGGGMCCRFAAATLTNCTFSGNDSVFIGSGISAFSPPGPVLTNCILWEDLTGDEIYGTVDISYSDIQGGYIGTGNINVDPEFADQSTGNLHLLPSSPCIDAGSNSAPALDSFDYDGQARIMDGDDNGSDIVDMGADETPPIALEVWVDDDWTGYNYGDLVSGHYFGIDAFNTIQEGMDGVKTGGTVHVADGSYVGGKNRGLDFKGRALSVKSDNGPYDCIIDCEHSNCGFRFYDSEGTDSVVDGFTITNGYLPGSSGGGIDCSNGSPTIARCFITGNHAQDAGGIWFGISPSSVVTQCSFIDNLGDDSGGGILCSPDSSPLVTHCTFSGNVAEYGGGIYCHSPFMIIAYCTFTGNGAGTGGGLQIYSGAPQIVECSFSENTSSGFGGGIYILSQESFDVDRCTFTNNAGKFGGGIYCGTSSLPEIINCEFVRNLATDCGGGLFCEPLSSPNLYNCTFMFNSADSCGGGFGCWGDCTATMINCTYSGNEATFGGGIYSLNAQPTVVNCIVWGNTGPGLYAYPPTGILVDHSNIQGGWPGTGNINADPYFVEPESGDCHISYESPCRDTGDNNAPSLPEKDNEGDPRIGYGTADMGSDEFYPHLYCTGDFTPGGQVKGKVIGLPHTTPVYVLLSNGVRKNPVNTQWGELWLLSPWVMIGPLWPIPADGVMILAAELPVNIPPPYDVPFQALIGSELSNLFIMEVR